MWMMVSKKLLAVRKKLLTVRKKLLTVRKKLLMVRKILHLHNLCKGYTDFLTVSNFLLVVSNLFLMVSNFFWQGENLAGSFWLTNSATYLARHTIGKMTVAYVTTLTNLTAETCLGRTYLVPLPVTATSCLLTRTLSRPTRRPAPSTRTLKHSLWLRGVRQKSDPGVRWIYPF